MVRLSLGLRTLSAVIVMAGLLLTLDGQVPAPRPPVVAAGYTILAADLHVHSFPGDGLLPPWEIAVEARRRRLDAVALTNHNSNHSWRLARWLAPVASRGGAMLIPGREVTAMGYHLAVLGVDGPIAWRQPASSAAAAVHAAGGVAIAAHPEARAWPAFDDAALRALDGVEVGNPMVHGRNDVRRDLTTFYQRATRVHPSIAAIGSTDFHHFAPLGLGRTYVFARPATQAGILEAIRAGRTVACDGGDTYGPPELVAIVGKACRDDATAPPQGQTGAERAGTWLVWVGLLALVLLGPGEPSAQVG